MQVIVNGEVRELPEGTNVEALLDELGLASSICAAEVNNHVVPRDERRAHVLAEGDTVEIVTLVGGG